MIRQSVSSSVFFSFVSLLLLFLQLLRIRIKEYLNVLQILNHMVFFCITISFIYKNDVFVVYFVVSSLFSIHLYITIYNSILHLLFFIFWFLPKIHGLLLYLDVTILYLVLEVSLAHHIVCHRFI